MRIVIEIDSSEGEATSALPNTITISFPQAVGQPDTSVHPDTGRKAITDLTTDDQEAGAAPEIDPGPGEPAVYVQPAVPEADAPGIKSEAMDAGPASDIFSTAGESSTSAIVTDNLVSTADSEDMNAGTAPVSDLTENEPSPFVAEIDDNFSATESEDMDAGASLAGDLTESEPSAFSQQGDQTMTAADTEAMDAGTANIDHLLQDESDMVAPADTGDDQGIGFPADDAGAAPMGLFTGYFGEEGALTAPDDLTAITGIGPKIAGVLMASGITTYEHLAAISKEDLHQLVADAGISANVNAWRAQAETLR